MNIYTKTGDKGQTDLLFGERVDKDDIRLQALGAVDELSAFLGLAKTKETGETREFLSRIQRDLIDLSAAVADYSGKKYHFDPAKTTELEQAIDNLGQPEFSGFILYGDKEDGAMLHVARAVARRAERVMWTLVKSYPELSESMIYLNRLSDYLYVLAQSR